MTFHFIRPLWLLLFIPLIYLSIQYFRKTTTSKNWATVCDAHLLPYLMLSQGNTQSAKKNHAINMIIAILMILALAGPSVFRLPTPHFETIHPHVLLLDLSENILKTDLKPNRLTRAKFKLHDLFAQKNTGLMGLIVYTEEAFVASPLTHDTKTITALLDELTPDIMPVEGSRLDLALKEAQTLIKQSGVPNGDILVLTGTPPTQRDINYAKDLAKRNTHVSILPLRQTSEVSDAFKQLAVAGNGNILSFSDSAADVQNWLNKSQKNELFRTNQESGIPLWRDDGRILLIPAALLFLTLFRRQHQNRENQ